MASRLKFVEGNHTYWLADDNGKRRRVPSVSSLKSTLHQFNGERWYLGQAAAAAVDSWDELAAAAPTSRESLIMAAAQRRTATPREFGTAVHHYCEQLWTGEPVDVPEDYLGHVRAVAAWWTVERVALVAAERMCWSEADEFGASAYAGRFDLLVSHPTRGVGLLDLKSWMGQSSGTPRPAEWAFQLTAYSGAERMVDDDEDVPMPKVDWCGVLHVGPSDAVLHVLPDEDRDLAGEQVMRARMLKAAPMPKMVSA